MIDKDAIACGILYSNGEIFIESIIKYTYDSNKWYSIRSDGSGIITNCWDTDGDSYMKGTFNSVLKLAVRFKENQSSWSLFANKVFCNNSYQFTKSEILCLLNIVEEIKKGCHFV